MKSIQKLKEWISDADSEFYYVSAENDKLEFEFVAYSGYEYFFESVGFPKDRLTFEFINRNEVAVIISTDSSFLKIKYEITSNILSVRFLEKNLVEIKTDRFTFTMFREKLQSNIQ